MSSKPTTPIASRRWTPESERSRIPISLSPVPFRRTNSMRLRTNCLLNETTLKQHNRNLQQTRATVDRNQKQLKLNLNYQRRGSLLMDAKSDSNGVDSGGTDEVDKSSTCNHSNGSLRRSSFNRNGMVRKTKERRKGEKGVLGRVPSVCLVGQIFFRRHQQCYVIKLHAMNKKNAFFEKD